MYATALMNVRKRTEPTVIVTLILALKNGISLSFHVKMQRRMRQSAASFMNENATVGNACWQWQWICFVCMCVCVWMCKHLKVCNCVLRVASVWDMKSPCNYLLDVYKKPENSVKNLWNCCQNYCFKAVSTYINTTRNSSHSMYVLKLFLNRIVY